MSRIAFILTVIGCLILVGCSRRGEVDGSQFNVANWETRMKDPALSEEEFTRLYAVKVAAEFKGAKVRIVGPRELSSKMPDGTELKSFLDNAWAEAKDNPENRLEIVERYLTTLKNTQSGLGKKKDAPDSNRILPVIRDLRYAANFKELGQTGTNQVLTQPLVADLLVMYVEDKGDNFHFLTEGDRRTLNLELPALHQLAITNLASLLPKVNRRGISAIFVFEAGGNLESSLLLVDKLWTDQAKVVEGDIVAAVPSRDALIFTGSRTAGGIQELRKIVARIAKDGDHLITDTLIVRRNGRWEKFSE